MCRNALIWIWDCSMVEVRGPSARVAGAMGSGSPSGHGTPLYTYRWGNNPKRASLKGRRCAIMASGALGSCMIRFVDDGAIEIVSRRALARAGTS